MQRLASSRYMNDDFPFWIQRVVHDANNAPEIHGHDFVELTYVVRGDASHVFEGTAYQLCAGDVLIINPGEVHTYSVEQSRQIEIINCLFEPRFIPDALLKELDIFQSMDFFYIQPFLNSSMRFYHRLNLRGAEALRVSTLLENMIVETCYKQPGYMTLIKLQMIELLVSLSRYYSMMRVTQSFLQHSDAELVTMRICGYLERNYHQKITLPDLSSIFGISVRQLNRIFRHSTGCTVIEKLHEIRIERAKVLLRETNEKVLSIATLVGYDDPAFFTRLFTRLVGCAPGRYRAGPTIGGM